MTWLLLLSMILGGDPSLPGKEPTAEQVQFFETGVRPVLTEHCQSCHGEKKQWGGLRLDSREALIKGGDSGAVVVAGKPGKSRLIKAIRHDDPDFKMPPKEKLSERQIADLTKWVEMGAPYPAGTVVKSRTRDPNHWSFLPPKERVVPTVKNESWSRTPIDRFVMQKLEAAGLSPAPGADKRTLIRRVTFDLTGLPPTPEEVDAFLNDDRADAYEQVIERLLTSQAYGERWGRHWLDVVRYADSNGLDENVAHGNAWRYRDYVVSAFNQDKPFDRFVREQLAGDLLTAKTEPERHEQLIATGLLLIGPKVLAEVDEAKMRMDIVDEQIDTVGRVFLGMTLGCARCHDHKFDPIDTSDYYALAGIFKSTRTMDKYTKIAEWHENMLPSDGAFAVKASYAAQLAGKKLAVEKFLEQANQQVREKLPKDAKAPEKLETLYPEVVKKELAKLQEELKTLEKNPPDLPAAMGATEDQVTEVAIHVRGNPNKLGDKVTRRIPVVFEKIHKPTFPAKESGRRELAEWLTSETNPLTARVLVNRVWRWHFGKGLVRTTDNFGQLGEDPTHPELLDWLAQRCIKDGWSIKSLHRLILTSSVYRQGSGVTPESAAKDPENRLWSWFPLQRLEAEEVRDALLAVSGQLDRKMGGSLLKVKNRGYLFDHTSIDLTDYSSRRRSLYLPVIRNNVYDVLQLLDFPDPAVPNGDRATTTVAPQALLMMNSELVMQSAEQLAKQVLADPGTDEQRISRVIAIAYGRETAAEECRANLELVSQVDKTLSAKEQDAAKRKLQAWTVMCHAILAANEFSYVR
ncbi:MAG: PSD1 and planctomycete cytochrome C domain-containing protein [Planctomycetales bacterium]